MNNVQNSFISILRENQRLLMVAGPLVLTLLIVIFAIIFMQPTQPQPSAVTTNQQVSSPTPNPTIQAKKLNIASVSPANGIIGVSIYTPLKVTFTKVIPKSEQSSMRIQTSPITAGSIQWSQDNTSLTFTPTNSFASQSQYTASIIASGETFTWTFQTVSNDAISETDVMKVELESAEYTKQQDAEFDRNYPWWDRFPVQSERYFAYFDPDKKKFVGLLYPSRSAATSQDAQVSAMKTEILGYIQKQGINVNQYGIEWSITPEP